MAKRSFKPSKGRRLRDGPVFKSGRCAVMRTEIRTQHLWIRQESTACPEPYWGGSETRGLLGLPGFQPSREIAEWLNILCDSLYWLPTWQGLRSSWRQISAVSVRYFLFWLNWGGRPTLNVGETIPCAGVQGEMLHHGNSNRGGHMIPHALHTHVCVCTPTLTHNHNHTTNKALKM